MLSLDDPRWQELGHAYGHAGDVPALLARLDAVHGDESAEDTWNDLWSALAHQGDVFPASFAAVPHVIDAAARARERVRADHFHFAAWVEICRARRDVPIPDDLKSPYVASLARLPALLAAATHEPWDRGILSCALAAIAAARGHHAVAEAIVALADEGAAEAFLERLCGGSAPERGHAGP